MTKKEREQKRQLRECRNAFVKLSEPIVVYKKTSPFTTGSADSAYVIVTLKIPVGAIVYTGGKKSSAQKMRTDKAFVVSQRIKDCNGSRSWMTTSYSLKRISNQHRFEYKVGETVEPTEPFDLSYADCVSGIHFFLTYDEARAWRG